MKLIVVDDENWSICQFKEEIARMTDVEICGCFELAKPAIDFASKNEIEVAILDIEMPFMDGIELGRALREINPKIILVYVTGYDQYVREAIIDLKADFYLMKPYDHKEISDVLEKCRALCGKNHKKDVEICCFGGFEVYIGGELVHFANKKAKELLALCVHVNGKHVSLEKAIDLLWENHPYDNSVKSLYRKSVIYLNAVFREHGITNVFENGRGYCCINRDNVKCDYFDYLNGNYTLRPGMGNEYMQEYSWSEGTFLNCE